MTEVAYCERFWREVREHWGVKGERHVRELYGVLVATAHRVDWGPPKNKHANFLVIAPEFHSTTYLRVYSDAILHFYTQDLPSDSPIAKNFRSRIDGFTKDGLDANVDNQSLYLVPFERWIPKSDELKQLLRAAIQECAK